MTDKTKLTKRELLYIRSKKIYPATPKALERYRLQQVDNMTTRLFPVESRNITKWFLFRDYDQCAQFKGFAGWHIIAEITDDAYIGICDIVLNCRMDDGINTKYDYKWSVILHEIAHLQHILHQQDFQMKYEELVKRYTEATGRNIWVSCDDIAYNLSDAPKAPRG